MPPRKSHFGDMSKGVKFGIIGLIVVVVIILIVVFMMKIPTGTSSSVSAAISKSVSAVNDAISTSATSLSKAVGANMSLFISIGSDGKAYTNTKLQDAGWVVAGKNTYLQITQS